MVFNDKAMRYYTLILCVLFKWTINKVSDSLGRSDFQQARSLYHGFLRSSLFVVIDVYITSPLNSGLFLCFCWSRAFVGQYFVVSRVYRLLRGSLGLPVRLPRTGCPLFLAAEYTLYLGGEYLDFCQEQCIFLQGRLALQYPSDH